MTDPGPDAEFEPFLRPDDATPISAQSTYDVIYAFFRDRLPTAFTPDEAHDAATRLLERLRAHYLAHYEHGASLIPEDSPEFQAWERSRTATSAPEFGDHFDGYERLMETTGVGGARRWEDVKAQRAHDDEVRRRTQEYWAAVTRSRAERRGIKPLFCGACMAGIKHRHGDAVPEYQGEQE
jgi:hypothetical protein